MSTPDYGKPQRASRKKRMSQPLPKWHRQQGDSNDCGPYSVSFVANGLRDAKVIDPDALARRMEGPPAVRGSLLPLRIKGWATLPWGVMIALRQAGLHARWHVWSSLRDLWANLNRGWPTIVIVGQPLRFVDGRYAGWSHYKVLYAWDADVGFTFVDPAAADGVTYTTQDQASFVRQWTAMGRQIIVTRDR